jgi:hypothetical protein
VILGSGAVTFQGGSASNEVWSTSASNWNAGNSIDGCVLYLHWSQYSGASAAYDLTTNTLNHISFLYGTNLTLQINSTVAGGIANFVSYNTTNDRLVTSDAALDLTHSKVTGMFVTSTNTQGTAFTVADLGTALQVEGGPGNDTLAAQGFTFSADQRTAIFNSSSIEKIIDPSGTYISPLVDVTAPVVTASESVSGWTNQTSDLITVTATDAGSGVKSVEIFDNGNDLGAAQLVNGVWTFTAQNLTEGSHAFTATATDNAGNTSAAVSAGAPDLVDVTAPTAPTALADKGIVNGYVNASNDDATHDVLTGTAEKGSIVTVYDNGSLLGTVTADQNNGAFKYSLARISHAADAALR